MPSSALSRASSQYYTVNSPVNATADVTIGCYFKFQGSITAGGRWELMCNEGGSASGFSLHLWEVSSNLLARFGVFNGSFPSAGNWNTFAVDAWYIIVGVRDSTAGQLRLYDAVVGSPTVGVDNPTPTNAGGAPSDSANNLRFGSSPVNSGRNFNGLLFRPFIVLNHVASTTEIDALSTTLPEDVFSGHTLEIYRPSGGALTNIGAGSYTVTNNGTTEDADVPITESTGGGGGNGGAWYYYAQQRQRIERLWKRRGLLWEPSYA